MTLSNRQRRLNKRRIKAEPRRAAKQATTSNVVKLPTETERDSLARLHHRGILTRREYRAGTTYRTAYSEAAAEGVPLRSCIGSENGGGGARTGQPPIITALEAKQTLFWLRWAVLGGQPDAVGVMDAVCGKGLSLAEISRGNDRISGRLETALKIALGQCATALENKGKNGDQAKRRA